MSKKMELLSVAEVSRRTGISVPALHRYKNREVGVDDQGCPTGEGGKLARWARGCGRKMMFSATALPLFVKLRDEGLARRGRPRKV